MRTAWLLVALIGCEYAVQPEAPKPKIERPREPAAEPDYKPTDFPYFKDEDDRIEPSEEPARPAPVVEYGWWYSPYWFYPWPYGRPAFRGWRGRR